MPDKDFKIRFSAQQDGTFGRAVQETTDGLRSLKGEAASLASSFTGGLVGGGLVGFFTTLIDRIQSAVKETRELKKTADDLNIGVGSARTINALESGTGLAGVFTGSIQAGRRARADALAGDPEAVKAFERLGISLREIKDLKPDDLFYRVATAFERFDANAPGARERFFSGARIFGGASNAEALIPFFSGGLLNERRLFGRNGDLFAAALGADPTALSRYKKDFEPFSEFGVDSASRAAKLAEQNRYRAAEIARSQLPVEQQINDVLAQRVQIERDLQGAPSELRRQQLIGRLLDADQSLATLRARQLGTGTPDIKGAGLQRNLDDLSRAGFFTNGSPVALGNIQADQLKELKEIVNQLRKAPAETARAL